MKPAVISVDPATVPDNGFLVGAHGVLLDGKPFPWPTLDDWRIWMTADNIAYLEVRIAITFAPLPNDAPAAPDFTAPQQGSKP